VLDSRIHPGSVGIAKERNRRGSSMELIIVGTTVSLAIVIVAKVMDKAKERKLRRAIDKFFTGIDSIS